MNLIEKLNAMLTTKSMAAASGAAAFGGAATERLPRLAEATLFEAFGFAVTLPALSMIMAILAGLLALLRPALLLAARWLTAR